jgi:hypothetical protein
VTPSLSIPGIERVTPADTHETARMSGFPHAASILTCVRWCPNARRTLDASERDLGS